ncbi:MAG: hypothetical protein C3F02_04300 [Parcubacteria group bacterium]|nr:MAG: hypothetical protein C3F02_04300 [Parcubacteria group bacterium]
MLLADRRGDVAEVVVQVVAAPVPLLATPGETADVQVAAGVAVDGTPEVGVLSFPLLGDEVRVGQIELQQVGVVDRPVLELLAKLVADDPAAILLSLVQMEGNLLGVELQLPTTDVLLDLPAVRHEGVGVEIDDVFDDDDLGQTVQHSFEAGKFRVVAQLGHFIGSVLGGFQSIAELVHLTDGIQARHGLSFLFGLVHGEHVLWSARGLRFGSHSYKSPILLYQYEVNQQTLNKFGVIGY